MRDQYISELIKEIRGPRYGTAEILSSNPYTEYITGVIIPKKCKNTERIPDFEEIRPENDEESLDDGESKIDYTFSVPSELDAQMKPKSFGISFMVEGDTPIISICISWARYFRYNNNQSEPVSLKDKEKLWKRKPFVSFLDLNISESNTGDYLIYDEKDGKILVNLRVISLDGCKSHIILSLINDLNIIECKGEEITPVSIFQPSIRVNIKGDGKLIAPSSEINTVLDYQYMDQPVLARGHMCSAIWNSVDFPDNFFDSEMISEMIWPEYNTSPETRDFIHCDVRSEFIPFHPSPAPDFKWDQSCLTKNPSFSALTLSEMWREEDIEQYLTPIVSAYRNWIEKNEANLEIGLFEKNQISSEIIQNQKKCLDRLINGIDCLKNNEDARLAFCFANRVLWLQNIWKKKQSITDSKEDFSWRPFQLTFFLTCLESLYNQNSDDRDVLDLLWVPTGGGKTEAYLAIMAFTIALRRRHSATVQTGFEFDLSGAGVSIITRYTLRLLTVQQFRRTLLMITAAEYLRVIKHDGKHGWRPVLSPYLDDWLFGEVRFSIGMWVGGAVSPNHLRGEEQAIQALKKDSTGGDPAQIIKCPVCGNWLSIPRAGLLEGKNSLYLVIKSDRDLTSLSIGFDKIGDSDIITKVQILSNNLPQNFYILKIDTDSLSKIKTENFDESIRKLEEKNKFTTVSFRPSRPGYFPIPAEPGRKSENNSSGFEIFCSNPNCDLNKIGEWKEGVPCSGLTEKIGDTGLFLQDTLVPFAGRTIMPIPAYTTDEQIYHHCPTIIISTADKIARLAFEPRAGSMFGDVKRYNRYYGFLRGAIDEKKLLPNGYIQGAFHPGSTVEVNPFLPPDLILQDELHLMDGPLGSMFGLYEMIVDGLIRHAGGRSKYVASSATVKRAEDQVSQLFNRKTFQFPPNGLNHRDNFFARFPNSDTAWDENGPGKVYMGIYAPGMGPLTPIIRLWARILQTGHDLRAEREINNFWTLVGYFNSVRELGGAGSLYREDIVERLAFISENNPRILKIDKMVELSSRINSTDIPQLLEDLEQGKNRSHIENPDAVLTTSMFGTGVDIPHLSLMVVNGQPKTTSQYIQATGRVGREHGALVTVFYKAGRPRDLSHYELFTGYHNRINLSVESASVSPFSRGCLERGAGPVLIAFLRNMREAAQNWAPNNGHLIQTDNARKDFDTFLRICFGQRNDAADIIEFMKSQFDMWENCSKKLVTMDLLFSENTMFQSAKNHVVLGDPAHELMEKLKTVYKNAPQSLRDIEETTAFEV